eukprot:TRINITY_DN8498_c0_g1_i1.p1 TRINITY_DN8498_c0_g1~~TRINITY_DN8498_c0_g1_i1.p1  ORF type:complete len:2891 (+),score=913.67 TRINITY_DN8498_c0_g1_i1:119-8791(+)
MSRMEARYGHAAVSDEEVQGYVGLVMMQVEEGQGEAMFGHVVRLVETLKGCGEGSVQAVVQCIAEVGKAYPHALRDLWGEFVDTTIQWYLDIPTPQATLDEIEHTLTSLSQLWKAHPHAHHALYRLTNDLSEVVRKMESQEWSEPYIQKVHTNPKGGGTTDIVLILRLTTCLAIVQEVTGMTTCRVADPLLDAFSRAFPFLKRHTQWVTNVIRIAYCIQCEQCDPQTQPHSSGLQPLVCKILSSQPSLTDESGNELLFILQQLLLEEFRMYMNTHSYLLDSIEDFIKTASVETEAIFLPRFSDLYKCLMQNPFNECNDVLVEVVRRIREHCDNAESYCAATQRVVAFLFDTLKQMLERPETRSLTYLEMLETSDTWVPALPASGAAGSQFVEAISSCRPSHLPVTPLAHITRVIRIVCNMHSVYEAAGKLGTPFKLNILSWVRYCLSVVCDSRLVLVDYAPEFVAILRKGLGDNEARVRQESVTALALSIEASDREVVSLTSAEVYHPLCSLLSDSVQTVRHAAFKAFCRLVRVSGPHITKNKVHPLVAPLRARQFGMLVQIIRGEVAPMPALRTIAAETYAMARSLEKPPTSEHDLVCCVISAAVRYCVSEKLKTALGDAKATFSELERLLKGVGSTSFLHEDNYLLFADNCATALDGASGSSIASTASLGDQLILVLLNELEKWVYLAQEGYVIEADKRQTAWPSPSTVFFSTNKKVCDDYFARLRLQMVAAGETMISPLFDSMFVRSCGMRLQVMKDYVESGVDPDVRCKVFIEMEKFILTMCYVYIRKRCGDMILGYLTWVWQLINEHFVRGDIEAGSKLDIVLKQNVPILKEAMLGMAKQADGNYEEALQHYKQVFSCDALKYSQLAVIRIISQCCVACCTKSLGWKELQQWVKFLKESLAKDGGRDAARERKVEFVTREILNAYDSRSCKSGTELAIAVQYAKALSEWEEGNDADCFRICTDANRNICTLSSNWQNKGPGFRINPEQVARLRILRALAESSMKKDLKLAHEGQLREAIDLLQRHQAIEPTEEGIALGDILVSLVPNPSSTMHKAEKFLILGTRATTTNCSFPEMLLRASRDAREAGNITLSAKLLKKLMSLPEANEWKAESAYETCCLQFCTDAQAKGIEGLWAAGSSGKSVISLLKLHELVNASDRHHIKVAQCAKVHPSDVDGAIVRAMKTHYPRNKAAMCRYAEWTMKMSSNEASWAEAVKSHLAALHLSTQADDPPLTDMNLALRLLKLLQQGATSGFYFDNSRLGLEIVNTPLVAWRDISLQLMAHLTSTSPMMHQTVKQLLQRLCAESPMLLLYPLIAALGTTKQGVPKQSIEELWRTLTPAGDALQETKSFVSELVRVTELLDEETNAVVATLNQSLTKVLPSYKSFVRSKLVGLGKTANDSSSTESKFALLKRQKFEALLQPLVQVLEKQIQKVQCPSMCLHDCEFQMETLPKLQRALHELKKGLPTTPHTAVDDAVEAAHTNLTAMFTRLHKSLNDSERRPHTLSLGDISSVLTRLKDTSIPIPGCQQYVSITRLEQHVEVVESKTRPKKLVTWGNDGKKYTFLLKGKEDLSLDERVMQVLRTATVMLGSSHAGKQKNLRARSYAVVPLGDRSGLIRFVDNVHPVFHLHRQWTKRKATVDQLNNVKKSKPGKVSFNPVHHFFAKLLPALKEVGIANIGTRTDWPDDVLAKVFAQLSNEVPEDLLTRELWCRGTSAFTTSPSETGVVSWLERNRRYASSLAVMSVVGYVIGLGDRHLDNILIDFDSGEIVHIDYNICFEKGAQLRVPEIVPFRLTPVLRHALGVQGVEGTFRCVAEDTMNVLRNNKDTLLGLLEAFVHDPLVEWTAKRICDPATEGMEVTVSVGVLATHLDETLGDLTESWQRCQDAITTLAQEAERLKTSKHAGVVKAIRDLKQERAHLAHQIEAVKQELNVIESKKITRKELGEAKQVFEAQGERCAQNLSRFKRVQSDCNEALPMVQELTRRVLDDPVGFRNASVRVSVRLCKSFGEIKDAKLLKLLGKVDQHELRVMSTYETIKNMTKSIVDYLTEWQGNVVQLQDELGINYSSKNCCTLWAEVYGGLAEACTAFSSDGLEEKGYAEFIVGVDKFRSTLEALGASIQQGVLVYTAPFDALGIDKDEAVARANDLLVSVPALQAEVAAVQHGEDYSRSYEAACMKLDAELCESPEHNFSMCYAGVIVLTHISNDMQSSVPQGTTDQHSWERCISLSEMEEHDDVHLFLHLRWHTLTVLRKGVASLDYIHECMGDITNGAQSSITTLSRMIVCIEDLLVTFTKQLSVSFAFGTQEFLDAALVGFQANVVEVLSSQFPHVVVQEEFLAAERKETLTSMLDVLALPAPTRLRQHHHLRRLICALRSFINIIIEVCIFPACRATISLVLRTLVGELSTSAKNQIGRLNRDAIRPASTGLAAQVEDLVTLVAGKAGGRWSMNHFVVMRNAFSGVCNSLVSGQAGRLADMLRRILVEAEYYEGVTKDVNSELLHYGWLLEPYLTQQVPNGLGAMNKRQHIVAELDTQMGKYKALTNKLAAQLRDLYKAEFELMEDLAVDKRELAMGAVQQRRLEFDTVTEYCEGVGDTTGKVIYLETLRNMSVENEGVHNGVSNDAKTTLEMFNNMVRAILVVKHSKERYKELSSRLATLLSRSATIEQHIKEHQTSLNILQNQSSKATAGAYSEVIVNKTTYLDHMKHIESLVSGVLKTLAQFPTLKRLHSRVRITDELCKNCIKGFTQWCLVFDRLWGPEAGDDGGTLMEGESAVAGVEGLKALHVDCFNQLEDLGAMGTGDFAMEEEEADARVQAPAENTHAKNIIKRVESKLSGFDEGKANRSRIGPIPDLEAPITHREQVDKIIKEATSTTNLVHMYEGWTAWI